MGSAEAILPEPYAAIAADAASVLGAPVVSCEPLSGAGGYTPALRLRLGCANGRTAFAKVATTAPTAEWLRTEGDAYHRLGEQPFLARFYGCIEGVATEFPLLLLEDLSDARWPPAWQLGDVERVLAALEAMHSCSRLFPPGYLRLQEEDRAAVSLWSEVQENPEPFLSLGFCSAEWLGAALPTLPDAAAAAVLDGDDLVHQDIRSDNLCFTTDGRAVIVDWNWISRGSGKADIAGWLPSLRAEGGPLPETILPNEGELAALLAGFWAARAGMPPVPGAPRVRQVQKHQLAEALPWAVRALGLPPLR